MNAIFRRSVSSLEIPNYRRWFAGQLASVSGNWMQIFAEMWLIVTVTGSAFAVGLTAALQFLPVLLLGAWGGLIADSVSKRKLLFVTQTLMALPALVLFGLSASGDVAPWMVMALVFARGTVMAVDMPARHSFVIDIVGSDRVVNAVGLQNVLIHSSRIAGPAMAGLIIAAGGIQICFLLNALSFGAMILALHSLDTSAISPPKLAARERGAVRHAFRYVAQTPALAIPLGLMALVGTLGFNFLVVLPLLARETFGGGPTAYSALVIAMGIGSIGGALATSVRGRVGDRFLVLASLAFGVFALLASVAPTLELAVLALVPLGAASVSFSAGISSTLQLASAPHMRGRVMALYAMVFLGSTPIGGPITGLVSGTLGPRFGLVMAGVAALIGAVGAAYAFARKARSEAGIHPGSTRLTPARAAEAEVSPTGPDRDKDPECEPASRAKTPTTARRRSERRPGPRSPAPRPRDGATRAR